MDWDLPPGRLCIRLCIPERTSTPSIKSVDYLLALARWVIYLIGSSELTACVGWLMVCVYDLFNIGRTLSRDVGLLRRD